MSFSLNDPAFSGNIKLWNKRFSDIFCIIVTITMDIDDSDWCDCSIVNFPSISGV